MKIGLIDVDGSGFPNLPLMKLSAWHKRQGDTVEWYEPLLSGHMERVYMSRVFSFSTDYEYCINADEIIKGGSGYAIKTVESREIFGDREDIRERYEVYDKTRDASLPDDIEHMRPDYSLYPGLTENTAYGFLTRGCPRGCMFCHVAEKEGRCSRKTADLAEFWGGQKKIVLLDPNITACRDWKELFWQLIDSGAKVDINQGMDIRMMTDEKAEIVKKIKTERVHFAWDQYEDGNIIIPRLKAFKEITGWKSWKTIVYVLVNFNTTIEQDLERIYTLREMDYDPYVMIYDKEHTSGTDAVRRLQRWVNNRKIFKTIKCFEDYDSKIG